MINERFEWDIFINENKLTDNMLINRENNFIYVLKYDCKDLSDMLYGCSSLTSINLSNFNTNNVTDMRYIRLLFFINLN